MSDFAERCAAAVAAVKHGRGCSVGPTYVECDCDRDARIGRGIAAMVEQPFDELSSEHCSPDSSNLESAALAAFAEAAQ